VLLGSASGMASGVESAGDQRCAANRVSRRSVVVPGFLASIGVVGVIVWRRIISPDFVASKSSVVAGFPSDYEVNEVKQWMEGKFYMVRSSRGFVALYRQCPHLGCTIPPPKEGIFECPCHLSKFDISGAILRGPAQRPMDRLPIRLVDGQLVVSTDESSIIRRTAYGRGDVFDPNSVA